MVYFIKVIYEIEAENEEDAMERVGHFVDNPERLVLIEPTDERPAWLQIRCSDEV